MCFLTVDQNKQLTVLLLSMLRAQLTLHTLSGLRVSQPHKTFFIQLFKRPQFPRFKHSLLKLLSVLHTSADTSTKNMFQFIHLNWQWFLSGLSHPGHFFCIHFNWLFNYFPHFHCSWFKRLTLQLDSACKFTFFQSLYFDFRTSAFLIVDLDFWPFID